MDKVNPEKRRWTMAQVKGRNTKPERVVRSLLHRMGYRFRIQRADLPGRPDIVLPKHRTAVFVHGCFWHRHLECKRATMPVANFDYWKRKFERNVERDARSKTMLESDGWRVLVVWECELKNLETLRLRLSEYFSNSTGSL
jgi:DNA mismatch endonuclease (patch repair protein)